MLKLNTAHPDKTESPMNFHSVFLGAGSNSGNRLDYLQRACSMLETLPDTSITGISPVYLSEPLGITDQDMFYNAVIRIRTALNPRELLGSIKTIETALGRPEQHKRWGPRVIDLDILLYGQIVADSDGLTIPHPEMHKRKFVLHPLLDIDNPDHPVLHCKVSELLEKCPDSSSVEKTSLTLHSHSPSS